MRIETTLLGCKLAFDLTRHDVQIVPSRTEKLLAYVGFGETAVLRQAKWSGGEWRDHRGEPFEQPPVCWYSLGMPDIAKA